MTKNIGLITTSSFISRDLYQNVDKGRKKLKKFGFTTLKSDNFFDNYFGSGGTGEKRAKSLEKFYDKNLDLVICSQGGDTANEILNFLDFSKIKNIPLMGFSDNTILINAISKKIGNINYLGPDLIWKFGGDFTEFDNKEFEEIFLNKRNYTNLLNGKLIKKGKKYNGKLWGGNIRCFLKLYGTKFFPNLENGILLIEEVGKDSLWWESIINELIQKGIINKINGIILGYCHKFSSDFGEKIEDLFLRKLKDLDIFIYKTDSFGHKSNHSLFPIGRNVILDYKNQKLKYE